MDKKLLKEISKLKYLNQYNTKKTLNENKVSITEQLGPALLKGLWTNALGVGLDQAMKLNLNNITEYFGKELVEKVDSLITKAVTSGRLINKLGMFNGNSIDLGLSLFKMFTQEGTTASMGRLERNLFYEAIASVDESVNKKVLEQIAATTEGAAMKSGTMSEEAFELLLKNSDSPLHGFSETFLRQVARTTPETITPGGKKAYDAVMGKLSAAGDMLGELMAKGYKWTQSGMVRIGGTGLFNHSGLVEISSKIHAALVDKYIGKLANYKIENIPKILQSIGLPSESIQSVIKAIQQGVPVTEKITKEIWTILTSRSTKELEVVFKEIFDDLGKNKWFMKSLPQYLDLMVSVSESATVAQIKKAQKTALLKILPGFTDESLEMILRNLAKKNPVASRFRKIWYRKGTDTSRFYHWISCGGVTSIMTKRICVVFKLHLLTSILPFFSEYASLKSIYDKLLGGGVSDKQQKKLASIKDILDPPAVIVQSLNDPTKFQFLAPADDKSVKAVNTYYDKIAEQLGIHLLTFVPSDQANNIGILPPKYQENPEFDEEYVQDADSMYAPSNGRGRWYTGPLLSELNKSPKNEVSNYLLSIFSSDWNNINEGKISNILTTRPSRFGIAKLSERYKIHTNRSLWGDLDQLSYGDGILQNFAKNLLFLTDTDKHNINLDGILRLPEYQKNDAPGSESIIVDPVQSIMNDWWEFPTELWDVQDVEGEMEEVQFYPEYSGKMPLQLMIALKAGPTFSSEDTEGQKYSMTVKSETDLWNIPATEFNKFLKNEGNAPFDKDLYQHPYIYELKVIGYDDSGAEMTQWVSKTNPKWSSVPKNSGIEKMINDKWKKEKEKIENEALNQEEDI
jgi:hypothetical protein